LTVRCSDIAEVGEFDNLIELQFAPEDKWSAPGSRGGSNIAIGPTPRFSRRNQRQMTLNLLLALQALAKPSNTVYADSRIVLTR
jgi:hypothetical protein